MIQDYGLHDLFNVVVSSKDVKGLKPHPDIFHAAADRIGLKVRHFTA
jgi:FMN phosphatase YigB (HAD superfamily)